MSKREYRGSPYLAAALAAVLVVSTVAVGGAMLADTAQSTDASTSANSTDWSMTRGDAARTGATAGSGPQSPYAATDWRTEPDGKPTGVVVADGTAFLGVETYHGTYRQNGAVYAYNATTGETEWNRTDLAAVEGSPAVSNGTVFVAASLDHDETTSPESGKGGLFALDADTGETKWSYNGTSDWYDKGSVTVADGTVFVANDTTVFAFGAATGEKRWTARTGGEAGNTGFAVADGTVFVTHGRTVTALDAATGDEQWSTTPPSADGDLSGPAVADDAVYVTSEPNRVYRLTTNGTVRWAKRVESGFDGSVPDRISAPAVDDGAVFVTTDDSSSGGVDVGTVHRLNATSGAEQWRFETAADVDTAPSVTNRTVFVAGQFRHNSSTNDYEMNPVVFALNRSDGTERWGYVLEQSTYDDRYDTVAPVNDRVYVVAHEPGSLTFDGYLGVLNGSETAPPPWHQVGDDEPEKENDRPNAVVETRPPNAEEKSLDANQTVVLNASNSTDPDGKIVSYEWDVDGDGEFEKTGRVVEMTMPSVCGSVPVTLRVTDDDGATATEEITLTVS